MLFGFGWESMRKMRERGREREGGGRENPAATVVCVFGGTFFQSNATMARGAREEPRIRAAAASKAWPFFPHSTSCKRLSRLRRKRGLSSDQVPKTLPTAFAGLLSFPPVFQLLPASLVASEQQRYLLWSDWYISGSPPWIFWQVRTHIRRRVGEKRYCCVATVGGRGSTRSERKKQK